MKKAVLSVEIVMGLSPSALWCNAKDIDHLGRTPDTQYNAGRPKETVHILNPKLNPMPSLCGKYTVNTVYSLGAHREWDGALARSMTTSVERHGVISRRSSITNITLINVCAECFARSDAKLRLKVGRYVTEDGFGENIKILEYSDNLFAWKEHGLYVK